MTMGRSLILRRIAAFPVDYLAIIGYALAVLGITDRGPACAGSGLRAVGRICPRSRFRCSCTSSSRNVTTMGHPRQTGDAPARGSGHEGTRGNILLLQMC